MKVIYVAGPYRAETPWQVEQNVRRAEGYALGIAQLGAMPLCPHTMARFFDGQCDDQFWLDGTAELLKRCDAMFVVPYIGQSVGTESEIEIAQAMSMHRFGDIMILKAWLEATSK